MGYYDMLNMYNVTCIDIMVATVSLGNEPAGSLNVHMYSHAITTKSSD